LGLNYTIPNAFKTALINSGAPKEIIDLYVLWSFEIGPDFWGFCCAGIGQTISIKEMLSLPPQRVFYVSRQDPHPAIYIRVLLSIEWCRQQWGRGEWGYWEKEWDTLYPLKFTSKANAETLSRCRKYIPVIARTLLNTRLRVLAGKRIPELFNMTNLAPENLERRACTARTGTVNLKGLRPFAQLTVFRLIRNKQKYSEETIDKAMTDWIIKLGQVHKAALPELKSTS
jgi:hypothetical protein